ncbi:MAG: NUDIX domain-containing protein [Planctomycetota bacterium]|nr:NUDIX domain-containing protein [Planctomycetota bacterium]
MTKNPKLLSSLAELFGPSCAVIGFKLLSGVSREELVSVARNQLTKANLHMTVANDLSELNEGAHPVMLVEAKSETRLTGHRKEVAPQIAQILCERLGQGRDSIIETFRFTKDDPGEIFHRDQNEGDYASVFQALPKINIILRSAWPQAIDAIKVPDLKPDTVLRALGLEAQSGRYHGGPFALHSSSDTTLLSYILPPLPLKDADLSHCLEIVESELRMPLLHNNQIIGFLLSSAVAGPQKAKTVRLSKDKAENKIIVDRVIEFCIEKSWNILANTLTDPIDLFQRQGYLRLPEQQENSHLLLAPRQRDDLQHAGSICLFNPVERTLLLGRRLTAPWKDHWCFPGGKVENNESTLEAARREMTEETGLSAPNWEPVSSRTVFVGSDSGRAYEVTNYQFVSIDTAPAIKSDELEAFWHPIDKVMDLTPMGAGTKRILRHVLKLFR